MVEIGSRLREAREREGIDLDRVQRDTRIRLTYLKALEDERFDRLPGRAYARAFLGEYAAYLGLEPGPFLDEFDLRIPPEDLEVPPPPTPRRRAVGRRVRLGAIVALVLATLVTWVLIAPGGHHPVPGAGQAPRPSTRAAPQTARPPARKPPAARLARLVLTATRGRCWIEAHAGSRRGKLLYRDTLEEGRSLRLSGRRLWLRLGAPWNLAATLNGKVVRLPERTGNVVVRPPATSG